MVDVGQNSSSVSIAVSMVWAGSRASRSPLADSNTGRSRNRDKLTRTLLLMNGFYSVMILALEANHRLKILNVT